MVKAVDEPTIIKVKGTDFKNGIVEVKVLSRLLKNAPDRYESYSDMTLNQWITLRIEVKDTQAKLFINNHLQPSLVVNDRKIIKQD